MPAKLKLTNIIKNTVSIGSLALSSPKVYPNLLDIKRVLVISLTHLGDMITLTPFFRSLRDGLTKAEIHVLVKEQVTAVIERCPYIDKILLYNAYWSVPRGKEADRIMPTARVIRQLREMNYDAVIVTHEHVFSSMMAYLTGAPIRIGFPQRDSFLNLPTRRDKYLKPASEYPLDILKHIGFKSIHHKKEFWITDEEMAEACNIMQNVKTDKQDCIFALHPGAGGTHKILPIKIYASIVEYIISQYKSSVILMGGSSETILVQEITKAVPESALPKILDMSGKTTIGLMAAIMSRSDVVITNDSGPMHIADSVDRPVISLFTASSPKVWRPVNNPLSRVIYHTNRVDYPLNEILEAIDDVMTMIGEENGNYEKP